MNKVSFTEFAAAFKSECESVAKMYGKTVNSIWFGILPNGSITSYNSTNKEITNRIDCISFACVAYNLGYGVDDVRELICYGL